MIEPCVCLCKVSHPDERGLCEGDADRTIRLPWGRMDLPVCGPCADGIERRLGTPAAEPTMPDPWAPIPAADNWDQSIPEAPIHEVISRVVVLVRGQLAEYITSQLNQATPSPARRVLAGAISDAERSLVHLLESWDAFQAAPDLTAVPDVLAPKEDKVVDLMGALEASVAAAKDARTRHPQKRGDS